MKLLKTDPMADARKAATKAAEAVATAEAKLVTAEGNLKAAQHRLTEQTAHRDQLRGQIKDLIRDGQLTEAERLGRSVMEAGAAIETAGAQVEVFGELVEELERTVVEAEQAAAQAHNDFHGQAADAMRPELIALIQGDFRKAWRHAIAGGARIPFHDWLHDLMHDAGSLANENLTTPVDLGHPEASPQAASISVPRRRAIAERIDQRRQAAADATARERQQQEEAARFAARVAANYAADEAAVAEADRRLNRPVL
jgi:hypothetical protein